MGNLFNALNGLKTNIFGGGNTGKTTPILRKHAIGINEESPVSKLDHDPFAYSSIQYPRNLTSNAGIGHYMLFYVNVQDKTKYNYDYQDSGSEVGGVTENKTAAGSEFVEGGIDERYKYFKDAKGRGAKGSSTDSEAVRLSKSQRKRGSGMSSYNSTRSFRN